MYMGIMALQHLSEVEQNYIGDHQLFLVNCLETPDDTIRRITLKLLSKNTNEKNVDAIMAKLLKSLVTTSDSHFKEELTHQVFEHIVRFSLNTKWFLDKLSILLENSSSCFSSNMINETIAIFEEHVGDDKEFCRSLVSTLETLSAKFPNEDAIVKLMSWTVGYVATRQELEDSRLVDLSSILLKLLAQLSL